MLPESGAGAPPGRTASVFPASRAENVLSVAILCAMAVLPLAEIVGRKLWRTGIPGSAEIVQHATLWIGFLGGALAAREGKLLSLGRAADRLPGRARDGARIFSAALSSGICLVLAWAGLLLVRLERPLGANLLPHVPVWAAQAVMPAGFALIAWRLIRASSDGRGGRAAAAAGAAAAVAVISSGAMQHPTVFTALLIALLLAVILGAPLFVALGGLAVLLFRRADVPVAAIPTEIYRLVTSPTLPTIPLFTFAGYLLTAGDASRRLVRLFRAGVGWMPGAVAVVAVLACTFFTTFTGASGVTILALGGLLLPALLAERYPERFSLGLITASGSLGLLFPPCLPVILYGIVAGVAVDRLFLGGLVPGLLMTGLVAAMAVRTGISSGARRTPFSFGELKEAIREAKWDLLVPVIVLLGIFGGFATTVETAAMTVFYVFLVETLAHRKLSPGRDFERVGTESATLIGGVLIILAAAMGLTSYLVDADVPALILDRVRDTVHSRVLFLAILNVFLLVVGCLMDVFSAIVVVVPIIAPLGEAFGVDPAHLGIIFLANLQVGYLTPPIGMNLFLSAYRFDRPLVEVIRASLPFLLILVAGVLAITYVPALTTSLLPG